MPKSSVDRYKDSDNRRQFLRFWGACVQSALPLKSSRTDDVYKGRPVIWFGIFLSGNQNRSKGVCSDAGSRNLYNQLTECPWICIRKKMALPGTLITVIFNDNTADASLVPVTVPVTGEVLKDQDAQALRIRMGDHSYLAVFNHRETGADMEYIGADGHYGLGRVMICEENQPEPEMTVLSW